MNHVSITLIDIKSISWIVFVFYFVFCQIISQNAHKMIIGILTLIFVASRWATCNRSHQNMNRQLEWFIFSCHNINRELLLLKLERPSQLIINERSSFSSAPWTATVAHIRFPVTFYGLGYLLYGKVFVLLVWWLKSSELCHEVNRETLVLLYTVTIWNLLFLYFLAYKDRTQWSISGLR